MAESEDKDGKGLFPVSANFTTDLHSIGQFIQDGSRIMFETVLWVEQTRHTLTVPNDPIEEVAKLLGHGRDDVTRIYLASLNEKGGGGDG